MPRGSGTRYLDNFHFKYYLFYFIILYIYVVALLKQYVTDALIIVLAHWMKLSVILIGIYSLCCLVFLYHKLCALKLARCSVIISS